MHKITKLSRFGCAAALAFAFAGTASAGIIGSSTTPAAIPDSQTVQSTIEVFGHGSITDLSASIAVSHTWVGDLTYTLSHGGTTVTLMSRPGVPASGVGVGDGINLSASNPLEFSDLAGLSPAETIGAGCSNNVTDVVGTTVGCTNTAYLSHESLSAFGGVDMFGTWTLSITDSENLDVGTLSGWSLSGTSATAVPEPSVLALLGLAMTGMFAARRRNKK